MKGYIFTYGVDGFGADTAPAFEEGCFLNFDKAFVHLVELNHNQILTDNSYGFYEEGYGVDFFPDNDTELLKAEEEENWELFDELMEKHKITNEIEINKKFINREPWYGFYALEEIEIIED